MFIRVKSTPNSPRKSVQIVQSVRTGDKVRLKIVRHVGVAMDDDELQRLRDLAEFIKAKLDAAVQPSLFPPEETARQVIEARQQEGRGGPLPVDLEDVREEQRITLGIHEVYGALYRQLGLDTLSANIGEYPCQEGTDRSGAGEKRVPVNAGCGR